MVDKSVIEKVESVIEEAFLDAKKNSIGLEHTVQILAAAVCKNFCVQEHRYTPEFEHEFEVGPGWAGNTCYNCKQKK